MKTVASYNISSHNALLVSLIILGIIFDGQLFGVLQIWVAILKHLTTIIVSVFLDMYCITIPTIKKDHYMQHFQIRNKYFRYMVLHFFAFRIIFLIKQLMTYIPCNGFIHLSKGYDDCQKRTIHAY